MGVSVSDGSEVSDGVGPSEGSGSVVSDVGGVVGVLLSPPPLPPLSRPPPEESLGWFRLDQPVLDVVEDVLDVLEVVEPGDDEEEEDCSLVPVTGSTQVCCTTGGATGIVSSATAGSVDSSVVVSSVLRGAGAGRAFEVVVVAGAVGVSATCVPA
ncbi:hypothetical protein, partial [Rhodococcus rhodochrous]|uniref:hypothetical protein n=1 Tax=Rhodococcus rhodochrous TaxID=1829 RepID=UPI003FD26537